MSDLSPVETVRELSRLFLAGDAAGAMALFHPDVRITQPASLPHAGVYVGPSGIAAMGAAFGEHWTRTIANPRIHSWGDQVVQLTSQTWTSKTTGRSATVDIAEVMSCADGHVSEIVVLPGDTALLLGTLDDFRN